MKIATVLALIVGLSLVEFGSAAENDWKNEQAKATTSSSIDGGVETIKPDDTSIVIDVVVLVSHKTGVPATINGDEITLTYSAGGGAIKAEVNPSAIGIVNAMNKPIYICTPGIAKGYASVELPAGQVKVGKSKAGAPLTVELLKNQSRVCVAFVVPKATKGKCELRWGEARSTVVLP